MKFIKLTRENNTKTNVNLTFVREISRANDLTYLFYNDNDYTTVKETIEQIIALTNNELKIEL